MELGCNFFFPTIRNIKKKFIPKQNINVTQEKNCMFTYPAISINGTCHNRKNHISHEEITIFTIGRAFTGFSISTDLVHIKKIK